MNILQLLGFFVIWQNQIGVFAARYYLQYDPVKGCKDIKSTTALLRLREYLFCEYESSVRSNHHEITTNISIKLIPQLIEIEGDAGTFVLHTWLWLTWMDIHLTWIPSQYDGITSIHVKSYEIWTPDIAVFNSGDMSHDQSEMPTTECLLSNTGNVTCVPSAKYISRCDVDFTYFPYDKHKCKLVIGSWSYEAESVDFQYEGDGITMSSLQNNSMWDIKFLKVKKHINEYGKNTTFEYLDYRFLATRHSRMKHASQITPAIALIFLTLTVLWLDSRSVERVAVASVNFICHLLCMSDLHWQLPYNGINTPHILVFYRESLILATFALILTVVLRKLQSMNTEMPNWISYATTFVLDSRAGRFLILKNEESKRSGEGLIGEENMDISKPEFRVKESSWRHFSAIVEWLSFFCVIVTYFIILIILVPTS